MNNFKMTVVDIKDLRVGQVVIEKLPEPDPDTEADKEESS